MRPCRSPLRTPHSALRTGFTLIELLVVIIIISLLLALLLPAVQKARTTAQEAKVIIEIKQLESAIAAFKVKYGIEPPSRISLYKRDGATGWDQSPESKAFIKRMWPQFDFSMPGGRGNAYPNEWGIVNGTPINMNSGECLMFFLGGIYDSTSGAPTGFSKNPAIPFAPRAVASSREGPFYEFDPTRIKDSDVPVNNVPEYFDSLANQTKPILYFSSYEGRGYRPVELPVGGTLLDVYRTNKALVSPPGAATQSLAAQKPQTFQIISPGVDNEYGQGGVFNPTLPNAGLANNRDYDNLTNFHGGRLNP